MQNPHESAVDINQEKVDDKKRELLYSALMRCKVGYITLLDLLFDNPSFAHRVCLIFDENLSTDNLLALVDDLRYEAKRLLGDKFETECQEAVAAAEQDRKDYCRDND